MSPGDPITLEALDFLSQPAGCRLVEQAAEAPHPEWRTQALLRKSFPASLCRAALALVELRRAARPKFPRADVMFFDRAGLEMASRAEVAQHHAARLTGRGRVLDLCCGIGGDLVELARVCQVAGVDRDPLRVRMARLNCEALGAEPRGIVAADVTTLRLRADVLYLDPARRDDTGRRGMSGASYSPPLDFAVGLREVVPHVAVKVAPGIDEAEVPDGWEIEYLSAAGQCREATLYAGALVSARRRATVLPGPHSLVSRTGPSAVVAPPGPVLYAPDPAVVRAHLIDELAYMLDAWKLDPRVAYLSGATSVRSPFARTFRVLSVRRFQSADLRRFLRGEGLRPVEIMRRRFPLTPEQVRRRLGSGWKGTPVTLVLTRLDEEPSCIICREVA